MGFLTFLKNIGKFFKREPEENPEDYSMVNFAPIVSPQQPLEHEETVAPPSRSGDPVIPPDMEQILTLQPIPPSDKILYRGELGPDDLESSPRYAPELRCQVDDVIIGTNPENSSFEYEDVPSTPLPPYTEFARPHYGADRRVYYADQRTGIYQTNHDVHFFYTQRPTNPYHLSYRDATGHTPLHYGLPPGPRSPHRKEQVIRFHSSETSRRSRKTPADPHPLRFELT